MGAERKSEAGAVMDTLLAILRGPMNAGPLYPNVWLAAALLMLKLFDVWSTNYIIGRKGGSESPKTLTYRLIAWFGLQPGLAVDFGIAAVIAWLLYPYWYGLVLTLVIQSWVTAHQWAAFKKSQPK